VDRRARNRKTQWMAGREGVYGGARAREVGCVVEMRGRPEWLGQREDNRDEASRGET
jgi:hypothetical protein